MESVEELTLQMHTIEGDLVSIRMHWLIPEEGDKLKPGSEWETMSNGSNHQAQLVAHLGAIHHVKRVVRIVQVHCTFLTCTRYNTTVVASIETRHEYRL